MTEHKVVYHYTNEDEWKAMKNGSEVYYYKAGSRQMFKSSKVRGLWPRNKFIPSYIKNLPREAHLPVSYALMEPEPQQWVKDGDAWSHLMSHLTQGWNPTMVLLEVNLLSIDNAYVVDAAFLPRGIGTSIEKQKELYQKRWATRIPFRKYDGTSHSLPEVIIPTPIPLERLKMVWEKDMEKVYRRAIRLEDKAYRERIG